MSPETMQHEDLLPECESVINEIFARCAGNAPNFGVRDECFKNSLKRTVQKYLSTASSETPTTKEIIDFLQQIQADDLFLALACANGNERAWWEFDQQHRAYLERVARHLARTCSRCCDPDISTPARSASCFVSSRSISRPQRPRFWRVVSARATPKNISARSRPCSSCRNAWWRRPKRRCCLSAS